MSTETMIDIPVVLLNQKNEEILKYLEPRSCHSDIIHNIEIVLRAFTDVKSYCPDGASYKYILWYVGDTVFACAHGMHNVCLRLPMPKTKNDKIKGAFEGIFSKESWWSFKYNYSQLDSWVEKAYEYGKNS